MRAALVKRQSSALGGGRKPQSRPALITDLTASDPEPAPAPARGRAGGAFSLKGCLQGLRMHLKTSAPRQQRKQRFKSAVHPESAPVKRFKGGQRFLDFDNDLNRCTRKRRRCRGCCPCSCCRLFDALHPDVQRRVPHHEQTHH